MSRRAPSTFADYLVVAISPALIMLLVGSLMFFLVEVFYQGQYQTRLLFIMAMFVMAIVCVARISMERDAGYAALFGAPLALVTAIALAKFVRVEGALAALSLPINLGLMALVWWAAHKLTWDCTLIDDSQDASGSGLLQEMGLNASGASGGGRGPAGTSTPAPTEATTTGNVPAEQPWWQRLFEADRRPHAPGLWVMYFSFAALPLFGIGGWFIPASAADVRQRAMLFLVIYVASGLTLLLATSFLGLRRYLRQRWLEMPVEMAATWVGLGLAMIAAMLGLCYLLPRPDSLRSIAELPITFTSPDLQANRMAVGPEGAQQNSSQPSSNTTPAQPGQEGQQAGSQDSSGKSDAQGLSNDGQQEGSGGGKSSDQGQGKSTSQSEKSNNASQSDQSRQSSQNKDGGKSNEGDGTQSEGENSRSAQDKSGSTSEDDGKQQNDRQKGKQQGSSSKPSAQQEPNQQDSKSSQNDASSSQQNSSKSRSSKSSQQQSSSQSASTLPPPGSNISIQWGGVLPWLLRTLFFLAMAIFAAWLLWRYWAEIVAAWYKLLAELRELWNRLFGGKKTQDSAEAPTAAATIPHRPFASFADPFASGAAARMSWAELVRYTFLAAEAWGRENGCPRAEGQTPHEFAAALALAYPQLQSLAPPLADAYGQIAYAPERVTRPTNEPLQRLWQHLRATSRPVVSMA